MQVLASPAFANEKINPYTALLYRELNKLGPSVNEYSHQKALDEKYNIIHFHWPDGYINQSELLETLRRIRSLVTVLLSSKRRGCRIVWTVHNIVPHDAHHPKISKYFMSWFINRCDGLIFMSEQGRTAFFNQYKPHKRIQSAIIPHGHYRNAYQPAIEQILAKEQLGLPADKKVLLSFGMVRPYKNIDTLIEIFTQAKLDDYVLVIAGNPNSTELAEKLVSLKNDNESVQLFLKFIPDEELHVYLSAADNVVLPYKAILNSGALLLALSFDKPVIAPSIGAFRTLQEQVGAQWIDCYEGTLHVQTFIDAILRLERAERPAQCPLPGLDWDYIAQATLSFYRTLAAETSAQARIAN